MTQTNTISDFPLEKTSAVQTADYLIVGGGCAGLSLAVRMAQNPFFSDKKIMVIEEDKKETDDRTWCFWERKTNFFEKIVSKRWKEVYFYSQFFSKKLKIAPYEYKMIRGIDFYNYCKNEIAQSPNIQWIRAKVDRVGEEDETPFAVVNKEKITAKYIFNSIRFEEPDYSESHNLLQHFKGCYIETKVPFFNPNEATLMDFRIPQENEVRFFYVLPTTDKKALVEFTIFSEKLLENEGLYDIEVKKYCQDFLKLKEKEDFEIYHEEFGVIPMTTAQFSKSLGKNIFNIGITAGAARPSTGYTFTNIQKNCDEVIGKLVQGRTPVLSDNFAKKRHFIYDATLLNVMRFNKYEGAKLFARLFRWNSAKQVLKFLDGETNFFEEYRIMNTTPILTFLPAFIKEIFRKNKESRNE
jgi:lycopene beta-cyclase